jgi:hypothetical protein
MPEASLTVSQIAASLERMVHMHGLVQLCAHLLQRAVALCARAELIAGSDEEALGLPSRCKRMKVGFVPWCVLPEAPAAKRRLSSSEALPESVPSPTHRCVERRSSRIPLGAVCRVGKPPWGNGLDDRRQRCPANPKRFPPATARTLHWTLAAE